MKFLIDKQDLHTNIQQLVSVIPSKNVMPILMSFLISADAEKNEVKVTVSDLDLTVRVLFEANVEESGTVCVPAKQFSEIINAFPNKMITFFKEDEIINIHCGKARFNILSADVDQYPMIPDPTFEEAVNINALKLKSMISKTTFAASTEQSRNIFTGVYWKVMPDQMVMAATDGKRIAEFKVLSDTGVSEEYENVVPPRSLNYIEKIIHDDEVNLTVKAEQHRLIIKYSNLLIFANLLKGVYPNYSKVIPTGHQNRLQVSKTLLKEVIRRISLMAREDSSRIKFDLSEDGLKVSTVNREIGEADELITDIEYNGDTISIAFNYRFLLQIISVYDSEIITITFGAAKEPILVCDAQENMEYKFLLMPLRLNN